LNGRAPFQGLSLPPVTVESNVNDDASEALSKFLYPDGVLSNLNHVHSKQVSDFLKQKNIDESVAFFLKSDKYTAERAALARQLALIR
jgi:hypothetical protein